MPVILGVVGLLVLAYIIPQLLPLAIAQWSGVNTSLWNFTGASGAASLWGLAPFMWVIGIFLMSLGLGFAIYELLKVKGAF